MSAPSCHASCNMQHKPVDCGPRFIGEAIDLKMEEIAIAAPNAERLFVVENSSRVDLKDIEGKIRVHLFLPEDVLSSVSSDITENVTSVTTCETVPTRLIADTDEVYIRRGTFDSSRSSIIDTEHDHRCSYPSGSPSEFLSEFLSQI